MTRSLIEQKLSCLNPFFIELKDDSKNHQGHVGVLSSGGGGHFILSLVSDKFAGMNKISRHKLVYSLLNDLILKKKIHAISMNLMTKEEFTDS